MYKLFNILNQSKEYWLYAGRDSGSKTICFTAITSNKIKYFPANKYGNNEHIQFGEDKNCFNLYTYKDYTIEKTASLQKINIDVDDWHKVHIYAIGNRVPKIPLQ